MGHYALQDLSVDVQPEELESRAQLTTIFPNLSLCPTAARVGESGHCLSIRLKEESWKIPPSAILQFHSDGFSGFQHGISYYLTDGSSVFHIQSDSTHGDAYLDLSFFAEPLRRQARFWSFALLKLVRPLGFYSLHGAGLVTPYGDGMLVLGPSGSGKSTLTLGLIRQGWRYLSDDALLLHMVSGAVQALALRKHFYIDDSAISRNQDLPLDDLVADNVGGLKCRVRLEETPYAEQQINRCIPKVLLSARIVSEKHSELIPLGHGDALKQLLEGSGSQLFNRQTMGQHLQLLNALLCQSATYELRAGGDLYSDASILVTLLSEANAREAPWAALSPS